MKSFRRVCITLVVLFCCGIVSAYAVSKEDTVLKDKGKLEQTKEGAGLKSKLNPGQTKEKLVLESKEGKGQTKENPEPVSEELSGQIKEEAVASSGVRPAPTKRYKNTRTKGYRGWVEAGGAVGLGEYGSGIFSFSTSHGYQFNPYFFLGAGIGVDYHFDWETVFMPIFANARVYFIDGKISPFVDAKIGYAPVDGSGVYFNPSIGVSIGVSKKCAVNISIGYNMQQIEAYYSVYSGSYEISGFYEKIAIHGLAFKAGFEF